MARDRQRAKQRQAERRAKRLAQQGGDAGAPASPEEAAPRPEPPPFAEPRSSMPGIEPPPVGPVGGPGIDPDLAVGAPPQDEGRSDTVIEDEAELEDDGARGEALEEVDDWELDEEDGAAATGTGEAGYEARGRRGREDAAAHKDRPRVVQVLVAVWAELQRVQWPDRQALVTLTGVVLGFVLIAGGYLGLLDAIFSELIKAIL